MPSSGDLAEAAGAVLRFRDARDRVRDASLKLDRAREQLNALRNELSKALDADAHPFGTEFVFERYRGLPAYTLTAKDVPVLPPLTGV